MTDSHQTENENKTHAPDSGIGAMVGGEGEWLISSGGSGDIAKIASGDSPPLKPSNVLQLQRNLGNQATTNIINRFAQPKTDTNALSAFSGLRMVTPAAPNSIQRVDDEDGDGGVIERQDGLDEDDVNPETATDLDITDPEVQDESNEIDKTIAEAQQIQVIQPMDTMDSDMENQDNIEFLNDDNNEQQGQIFDPNAKVTSNVGVDLGDDEDSEMDDDNVQVIEPMDTDDSMLGNLDDDDLASSPVSNSVIKQKQGHKQKQGTHIKGHQLAGESVGPALGQLAMDTTRNVQTTMSFAEAGDAIASAKNVKDGLEGITDTASDVGSDGIQGLLGKVADFFDAPPMNVIIPVAALIYRIYAAVQKYKHMKAFKGLMGKNGGDVKSAKKRSTALKDKGAIGAYGFAKTKRGFWLRVIKAALTLGQLIARVVTLLTGGTAALISETVAIGTSLSNGIIKVGQSLKGIYKMIVGKRGKRRLESANWMIDAALDGDQEMLQFLLDGGYLTSPFLFIRKQKYMDEAEWSTDKDRLGKLAILSKRPKTTDEMLTYLKTAEELDMLNAIKGQAALMSTST